jgi:hypothetical protein
MCGNTVWDVETLDWRCACGQEYRIAPVNGEIRFWPHTSIDGYCRRGLPERATCIRCNARLVL